MGRSKRCTHYVQCQPCALHFTKVVPTLRNLQSLTGKREAEGKEQEKVHLFQGSVPVTKTSWNRVSKRDGDWGSIQCAEKRKGDRNSACVVVAEFLPSPELPPSPTYPLWQS